MRLKTPGFEETENIPLAMFVKADWAGCIKELKVMNINNNDISIIKLKYAFGPPKEIGEPRHYVLSMFCNRVEDSGAGDKDHPRSPRSGRLGAYNVVDADAHVLTIRYTDPATGEFVQRQLSFKFLNLVKSVTSAGTSEGLPSLDNSVDYSNIHGGVGSSTFSSKMSHKSHRIHISYKAGSHAASGTSPVNGDAATHAASPQLTSHTSSHHASHKSSHGHGGRSSHGHHSHPSQRHNLASHPFYYDPPQ